jgi:hypothetical protein
MRFQPCFQQEQCWDADDPTSNTASCWCFVVSLICVGTIFILFAEVSPRRRWWSRLVSQTWCTRSNTSTRKSDSPCDYEEVDFTSAFLDSNRTEENFVLENSDTKLLLPNAYEPEYTPKTSVGSFYPLSGFFNFGHFDNSFSEMTSSIFFGSAGVALICSAFSSVLLLGINYGVACSAEPTAFEEWVTAVGDAFTQITNNNIFYPIFLLVGYISFLVDRWRKFLVNCHRIQGAIHNVAILAGGSAIAPVRLEVRQKLYKIYRYLNLIHALNFKSVSPTIGPLQMVDFVKTLGLVTEEELARLLPMDNKMRDTVISWLGGEIASFLRLEGVDATFSSV